MRPPRRDDALRNRRVLLAAALETLTAGAAGRPLHVVLARRTGPSRSTVDRLVGDRHEIAASLLAEHVADVRESARAVVAGTASVHDRLAGIFTSTTRRSSLVALVRELPGPEQARIGHELIAAVTPAVEHAVAHGQLPADLTPADLRILIVMLQAAQADADDPDQLGRMVELVRRGLRP